MMYGSSHFSQQKKVLYKSALYQPMKLKKIGLTGLNPKRYKLEDN